MSIGIVLLWLVFRTEWNQPCEYFQCLAKAQHPKIYDQRTVIYLTRKAILRPSDLIFDISDESDTRFQFWSIRKGLASEPERWEPRMRKACERFVVARLRVCTDICPSHEFASAFNIFWSAYSKFSPSNMGSALCDATAGHARASELVAIVCGSSQHYRIWGITRGTWACLSQTETHQPWYAMSIRVSSFSIHPWPLDTCLSSVAANAVVFGYMSYPSRPLAQMLRRFSTKAQL